MQTTTTSKRKRVRRWLKPGATFSTAALAKHYGVTPRRIRFLADARGITPGKNELGQLVWTSEQAQAIKPGKMGWPKGRPRSKDTHAN